MTGAGGAMLITAGVAAGTIAVDRALKVVVEHTLEPGDQARFLGIHVHRRTNDRGIAGSQPDGGTNTALLAAGGALALGIAGAGVLFGRGGGWQGRTLQAGAGLLAGGMAANLLDRASGPGVTDFLPSPLGTLNAADVALGAGLVVGGIGAAAVALR